MQSGPVCRIPPDVCILSPPGPGDLRIHGPTPGGICLHDTDDAEVTDESLCCWCQWWAVSYKKQGCAHSGGAQWKPLLFLWKPHQHNIFQFIHLYKYDRKCYYERFPWPIICTQCDKEPILFVPITLTSLSGEVDCRSLYLQLLESCSASRLTSLVPTGRLFYQTCSGPDSASTRFERPLSFLRVCSFLLLKQVDQRFQNLFELVGSKQPHLKIHLCK